MSDLGSTAEFVDPLGSTAEFVESPSDFRCTSEFRH
jgi:hypothetical protein